MMNQDFFLPLIFNGMKILIAFNGNIPVTKYGGIERVTWYLGKGLADLGHKVTFLVRKGSKCDFADILTINEEKNILDQIPDQIDVVHFQFTPPNIDEIRKPYVITCHGNTYQESIFNINTIFVSKNHAERYGSESFVYNGLDWNDYLKPDLNLQRSYFHFLGKGAWHVKNLKGAIDVIKGTKSERLEVLGGHRFNLKMGFRFTFSRRIGFHGMIGGSKKDALLNRSKGLIFPVIWHEPFGLALIESLYFGCPVFATPYGSIPEIVNKDVGFLSCEKEKLIQAIEGAGSYSKKKCHQLAAEMFNSRKMALSYLEKYEQVMSNKTLNKVPPAIKYPKQGKFLEWK